MHTASRTVCCHGVEISYDPHSSCGIFVILMSEEWRAGAPQMRAQLQATVLAKVHLVPLHVIPKCKISGGRRFIGSLPFRLRLLVVS